MKVALVGGGQASLDLIANIHGLEGYEIAMVCDISEDAPGMVEARRLGIDTTTEMKDIAEHPAIELIFEITGVKSVYRHLSELVRPDQNLVSSETGRLVFDLISHHVTVEANRTTVLNTELDSLLQTFYSSLGIIKSTQKQLESLLTKIRLVNINGKIEAARAGSVGKAFSIVVDEMRSGIGEIQSANVLIADVLSKVSDSIAQLENTRSRIADGGQA